MEWPTHLDPHIEVLAKMDYESYGGALGDEISVLFQDHYQQEFTQELKDELNLWPEIASELTWADFIRWVFKKVKEWWNSLWD